MNGEIKELYRSDSTMVGSCNNMVLVFAYNNPEPADIDASMRAAISLSQRWPSGIAFMLCARPGARPPDPELRDRVVSIFKQPSVNAKAVAWVVQGEGFMPAAIRSVMAAFQLGLRPGFPSKVFGDVQTGVAWLVSHVDGLDGVRYDRSALLENARNDATSTGRRKQAR